MKIPEKLFNIFLSSEGHTSGSCLLIHVQLDITWDTVVQLRKLHLRLVTADVSKKSGKTSLFAYSEKTGF